ncbi:hypothetical protein GTQ40_11705 [Flavobacteriaceae bacterium R38]|nr:hypothetical protein [Flavobacteriaceae bacterium R38]
MISSIFGKTKPINFVFVFAYILLYFVIFVFNADKELDTAFFLNTIISLGVLVFSVFLVDFISKKNSLSQNNSYVILLFGLLISMFPQIFLDNKSVLANCFILFGARKCLSLKSQVDIKKKIFDASFWIGIAALFYNWSILGLILVFVAIVLYASKDFKNWLIPFVALFTILIFVVTYLILTDNFQYFNELFNFRIPFRILDFRSANYLVPFIFVMSMGFISLSTFFIKIKSKKSKTQASVFLMTILLIISFAILLLSGNKGGAEFIFIGFPLAVIVTNYLELITRKWLKEAILLLFIIFPIISLML